MNIIYYHKNDNDGKASGAIIYKAVGQDGPCKLKGLDYGEYDFEEEFNSWGDGDTVYLADFSFQGKGNMEKAFEKLQDRFVYIDHHKTAIDELGDLGVRGLREVGVAACRLCWRYFYPQTEEPEAIKLIGMYDVWELTPKVESFQFGTTLLDLSPTSENWKTLFKSSKSVIDDICTKGEIILNYVTASYEKIAQKGAFEATLNGKYNCVCINSISGNSKLFESVFDKQVNDIMLTFSKMRDEDQWTVSLYSADNGPDVGEIAKSFGGGGHKNAAGFQIGTMKLIKMLNL